MVQEESDNWPVGSTPFARHIRPWFTVLLVLQVILLVVRWHMGDVHGALLMFAVCAVGVLAVSVGIGGVDVVYGGYFGLMAFVSGLLDLNLAIEHILWNHWHQLHKKVFVKGDLMSIAQPTMYLVCAAVQLASAFISYLLYKDTESFMEMDADEQPFATQDQARIYNAALSHTERQPSRQSPSGPDMKPFGGTAHKLP